MKWIGYLQLGISLVFIFLLSSCKKNIGYKIDFRYINQTNHEIYVYTPPNSLTIKPLDTGFIYGEVTFGNSGSNISKLRPPNIFVLKYDDIKCDTLSFNDTVINLSNYEAEDFGNEYYQYTYRFTEADYERAIDCE